MIDGHQVLRIAVVDDDQRVLESLKNLLESADHSVRTFESAAAMLDSRCLPDIDCLISDIGMPGMDGFELLCAVRAVRSGLPVILVTGHAELLGQVPRTDFNQYQLFKKPFDSEELLAAVSKIGNRIRT